MSPFLVADIGGTNTRFGLVTGKSEQGYDIEHVNILPGANYSSFYDAIQAYLDTVPGEKPSSGCVAIAGPVDGDLFKMTNLDWSFSKKALQQELGFSHLEIINDYTALALAAGQLRADDLIELKNGELRANANKAVFGPGTGLGVAGLAYSESGWLPIPSEGGHVNLAPSTPFEAEVITAGLSRFGHVSAEIFLSGPGLVNLYQCVCEVKGVEPEKFEPKDVTGKARDQSNAECVQTLSTFCSFLGAFAGNLALTYGAKGGVYITGGILPRMVDFALASDFVHRFCDKGVMSHYVENIPVNIVNHTESAFIGAAAWLEQTLDR